MVDLMNRFINPLIIAFFSDSERLHLLDFYIRFPYTRDPSSKWVEENERGNYNMTATLRQ